jgi:hypothetical protein
MAIFIKRCRMKGIALAILLLFAIEATVSAQEEWHEMAEASGVSYVITRVIPGQKNAKDKQAERSTDKMITFELVTKANLPTDNDIHPAPINGPGPTSQPEAFWTTVAVSTTNKEKEVEKERRAGPRLE